MALGQSGIEAAVCGVPGTKLCANAREQLMNINCIGDEDKRRVVFISVDWNGRGQSKEHSADLEFDLKKLFQELGAHVVVLRWSVEDGAGEQKLDDWLAAGGDITEAMRLSVEAKVSADSELEEAWDHLNSTYAIMHGNYVPLSNLSQKYNPRHLDTMANDTRIQVSKSKVLRASQIWDLQPSTQRNAVDSYVFRPAPLGTQVERYVWEDGLRKLNTAPVSDWLRPPWAVDNIDVAPFIELLTHLCQDNWEWMMQFLAHCAQKPTERGPHIVIFKDMGDTGKSKLFDTLDLVFGRYAGPIGDALTSSFNAALEHLVLATWSDPVIHGGFDRDLESALKNFSGDSKITINHKGGAKYTVKNYGRLLIATNKDWIVPVSTSERRYTVFGGQEKIDKEFVARYWEWVNAGGVEQIRLYLTQLELSIKIHEPGPRTEQRIEMERLSAPPLLRFVAEEFESKDIWHVDDIRRAYLEQTGKKLANGSIGKSLGSAGKLLKSCRVPNGPVLRLWAIRNMAQWDLEGTAEWLEEYYKGSKM